MADYNTVPLGQAGTGAAFVLGGSQAANKFIQDMDASQRALAQQELLKQQRAKQIAADWQKNQLKVDGGLYWQQDFDKRYQNDLDTGIKLRQAGVNPYNYDVNDPNQVQQAQDFLLNRQGIVSDIDTRKALEAKVGEQFKLLKSDPNAFRAQSVEALNNYINTPFEQAKRMEVPVLEKAFDKEGEFYKFADPVAGTVKRVERRPNGDFLIEGKEVDKTATRKIGEDILLNNPRGRTFIQDSTGLSVDELKQIPNTIETGLKNLTQSYEGDPTFREQIASQYGVTSLDQAKPILNQLAQEAYKKKKVYNDLLDSYVDRATAKVDTKLSETPYFNYEDQAIQRANLALSQRREARQGDEDNNNAVTVRQNLVNRVFKGDQGAIDEIQARVEANPKFNGGRLKIDILPNGQFDYKIPATFKQVKEDGEQVIVEATPATTVRIDPSNPAHAAKLSSIIDIATDEKVPYGNFKGQKGNKNKAQVTPISNNNYTNLTQARDSSGKVVTLGVKNGKWYNTKTGKEVN